jgi:glycosyltransferase involved in cell wall biosynthesis
MSDLMTIPAQVPPTVEALNGQSAPPAKSDAVVLHTRVVTGSGGGPDKTVLNSPRFLEGQGYRAICAYMHPPADPGFELLRERARACRATLLGIPDRGAWDLRVARDMLALCRRENVTIWHGHDYKSNALGLLLARFRPMRLVTTVHGWGVTGGRRRLYYAIDRMCLRRYERVICVSDDLLSQCLAARVDQAKCRLVYNAVDTDHFQRRQTHDDAKRRLGFTPGRLLIGAVGRLSPEKWFEGLITAVDRLINSGLDIELCIVGEGDERSMLERLIARLGRHDRVRLAGYQGDTLGWYEAMDIYALTSLREGLPNVVLEAMALEVPLVATRIAGVPWIVADGVNGLLIEPSDIDGLVGALRRLLQDQPLRARLARAGRETVEKSYSFAVRMRKVRAIYDELLDRAQLRGPCTSP